MMSTITRLVSPTVALVALFASVPPWQLARADEANYDVSSESEVRCVALTGDSRKLAVLGSGSNGSATLVVWDLTKGTSRAVRIEGSPSATSSQLAFSPDERCLIYTDFDRFQLFDTTTLASTLTGKGQRVHRVMNGLLMSSDMDHPQGQMHVYQLNASLNRKSFDLPRAVGNNATQAAAGDISADGTAVAFSVGNVIRVLDPGNSKTRPDITASGPVQQLALSPDGLRLAVWCKTEGPAINLYDWTDIHSLPQLTARIDLSRELDSRTQFDFPVGMRFLDQSGLCIGSHSLIGIWDLGQKKFTDIDPVRGATSGFSMVDLSPDFITLNHMALKLDESRRRFVGQLLRNDKDGDPWDSPIRLTHSRSGDRMAYALNGRTVAVRELIPSTETPQLLSSVLHLPNLASSKCMLISDDGAIVGIGGNTTTELQFFYETGTGKRLAAEMGRLGSREASFVPDSRLQFVRKLPVVFINSEKRQVLFLNAAALSVKPGRSQRESIVRPIPSQWVFRPLDGGPDTQAGLKSPDPLLRNGGTASRVFRWRGERYAFVAETQVPKPKRYPGERVQQLSLVDAESGEVIFNLADEAVAPTFDRGRALPQLGILVSSDGTKAVVPMDKGDLLLWDLETGKPLDCLLKYEFHIGGSYLGFSGSGRYLCAATTSKAHDQQGRQQLELLDLETGMLLPPIMAGPTKNHRILEISPTEPRYLTHSGDGTLAWRDLLTGRLISRLPPHSCRVGNAAFSADGKILGTISGESEVRFWKTSEPVPLREEIVPKALRTTPAR